MSLRTNPWLAAGGAASLAAAAHLACIAGGADWYRTFGAGERIARMVEHGRILPHAMTLGIAAVLAVWGLYALSGAGLVRRLPLIVPVLGLVTLVYLARGIVLFRPALLGRADLSPAFVTLSSSIVLAMGIVHAAGLWRLVQSPVREF